MPHTIEALSAAGGLRRPVVAHVRQEIETDKVRRYRLDLAEKVVAISRQVEQALIGGGVAREAVQTIYSGLQLPTTAPMVDGAGLCRALGLPADAVLLGTVAHLFPRKGYDVMSRD